MGAGEKGSAWTVPVVEVVEALPVAPGEIAVHTTLTVKVVPAERAGHHLLHGQGWRCCLRSAERAADQGNGSAATTTATSRAQPRDRVKTGFARTVPPASLRCPSPADPLRTLAGNRDPLS
jgi:hypothetical protein